MIFQNFVRAFLKAVGHRYYKRVPYMTPKGKRYRYFYRVTSTHRGRHAFDAEHLVEGTKFALHGEGESEFHGHITKVDGDQVTYTIDDGPRKGEEVTTSRQRLVAELNEVHGVQDKLTAEREKVRAAIAEAKRAGHGGVVRRLERRLRALGGEPEAQPAEPTERVVHGADISDADITTYRAVERQGVDALGDLSDDDLERLTDQIHRAQKARRRAISDAVGRANSEARAKMLERNKLRPTGKRLEDLSPEDRARFDALNAEYKRLEAKVDEVADAQDRTNVFKDEALSSDRVEHIIDTEISNRRDAKKLAKDQQRLAEAQADLDTARERGFEARVVENLEDNIERLTKDVIKRTDVLEGNKLNDAHEVALSSDEGRNLILELSEAGRAQDPDDLDARKDAIVEHLLANATERALHPDREDEPRRLRDRQQQDERLAQTRWVNRYASAVRALEEESETARRLHLEHVSMKEDSPHTDKDAAEAQRNALDLKARAEAMRFAYSEAPKLVAQKLRERDEARVEQAKQAETPSEDNFAQTQSAKAREIITEAPRTEDAVNRLMDETPLETIPYILLEAVRADRRGESGLKDLIRVASSKVSGLGVSVGDVMRASQDATSAPVFAVFDQSHYEGDMTPEKHAGLLRRAEHMAERIKEGGRSEMMHATELRKIYQRVLPSADTKDINAIATRRTPEAKRRELLAGIAQQIAESAPESLELQNARRELRDAQQAIERRAGMSPSELRDAVAERDRRATAVAELEQAQPAEPTPEETAEINRRAGESSARDRTERQERERARVRERSFHKLPSHDDAREDHLVDNTRNLRGARDTRERLRGADPKAVSKAIDAPIPTDGSVKRYSLPNDGGLAVRVSGAGLSYQFRFPDGTVSDEHTLTVDLSKLNEKASIKIAQGLAASYYGGVDEKGEVRHFTPATQFDVELRRTTLADVARLNKAERDFDEFSELTQETRIQRDALDPITPRSDEINSLEDIDKKTLATLKRVRSKDKARTSMRQAARDGDGIFATDGHRIFYRRGMNFGEDGKPVAIDDKATKDELNQRPPNYAAIVSTVERENVHAGTMSKETAKQLSRALKISEGKKINETLVIRADREDSTLTFIHKGREIAKIPKADDMVEGDFVVSADYFHDALRDGGAVSVHLSRENPKAQYNPIRLTTMSGSHVIMPMRNP